MAENDAPERTIEWEPRDGEKVTLTNVPDRIWLQTGFAVRDAIDGDEIDFRNLDSESLTWCQDEIEYGDVEYRVRADLAAPDAARLHDEMEREAMIVTIEQLEKERDELRDAVSQARRKTWEEAKELVRSCHSVGINHYYGNAKNDILDKFEAAALRGEKGK